MTDQLTTLARITRAQDRLRREILKEAADIAAQETILASTLTEREIALHNRGVTAAVNAILTEANKS